ncbi:DUF2304 domain-containing protein [Bacillus sp. JJ1609]|uniref:DUF2304 domain-containing protein n=1 Tax=Bacillus sp. JJ1609 TaxID=3122977 RepID=UPI002FFE063A
MNTVQLIAIIVAVFFLLQVIWLTSQHKLHDQQAFMWMLFAIGALFVAFGLPYLNSLAVAIGVSYMPSLIFLIGFFVVLSLLMYHTMVFSRQQSKLINLVQEVAYLSKELEDLKNSQDALESRNGPGGEDFWKRRAAGEEVLKNGLPAENKNNRVSAEDLKNGQTVEDLRNRQAAGDEDEDLKTGLASAKNKDMSGERQNEHS